MALRPDEKHINMTIKAFLHAKLKAIAADNGVSFNFLVRRALINVADAGTLPKHRAGAIERLSREKYGEGAVPTFDVNEDQAQMREDGRKDRAPLPE